MAAWQVGFTHKETEARKGSEEMFLREHFWEGASATPSRFTRSMPRWAPPPEPVGVRERWSRLAVHDPHPGRGRAPCPLRSGRC